MLRIKMLLVSAIVAMVMVMPVTKPAWAQVADLRITEVNYNPVGSDSQREHFEVTNFGAAAYTGDCTRFGFPPDAADRFIEQVGGADRSHILCLQVSPATFTIQPGEAVIFARKKNNFIAQFNPPTGCQVIDYSSSVSLNNGGGDIIRILDSFGGTVLASMSYDGSIANGNGNSLQLDLDTETYFEAPPTICSFEVSIDIKPGSDPNVIEFDDDDDDDKIKVAILSSPIFDALQVDPASVQFGPAGAAPIRYRAKDTNRDGFQDLLLVFRIKDTGLACCDTEATLTGEKSTGGEIQGSDSLITEDCGDDDDDDDNDAD